VSWFVLFTHFFQPSGFNTVVTQSACSMEKLRFLQFQQMSLDILGNQIHLESGQKIDVFIFEFVFNAVSRGHEWLPEYFTVMDASTL